MRLIHFKSKQKIMVLPESTFLNLVRILGDLDNLPKTMTLYDDNDEVIGIIFTDDISYIK